MKNFFTFFLGSIFFALQALCLPSDDYGEGWKWHTTLKATYAGKDFDFEPVHAEMWKSQRLISQITDGSNVNIVFVRFSIIYQADDGLKKSDPIKLTLPVGGEEIVFFSGWDEEVKNTREPISKSLERARLLRFGAPFDSTYVGCQRYCMDWKREAKFFSRRFSPQNLQNLYDPGDYKKDGAQFIKDEDYRLQNLSKRAEEMAQGLEAWTADGKKLDDLLRQYCSGVNIINGLSASLFSNISKITKNLESNKQAQKKPLLEKKKKLQICSETLALDVVGIALKDNGQLLFDNLQGVGQQLRRQLETFKTQNPLFLIAHFHSEMDPCHVCSPTFSVETKNGVLGKLSQFVGVPLATFVSSSAQYNARLYRPLSFNLENFLKANLRETSASLETLSHVVQCRFKTCDRLILQTGNSDECERFISTYVSSTLQLTTQSFLMSNFLTTSLQDLKAGLVALSASANQLFLLKDTQQGNLESQDLDERLTALKPSKVFFVSASPIVFPNAPPAISLQQLTTEEGEIIRRLNGIFEPIIDLAAPDQFFERFPTV